MSLSQNRKAMTHIVEIQTDIERALEDEAFGSIPYKLLVRAQELINEAATELCRSAYDD